MGPDRVGRHAHGVGDLLRAKPPGQRTKNLDLARRQAGSIGRPRGRQPGSPRSAHRADGINEGVPFLVEADHPPSLPTGDPLPQPDRWGDHEHDLSTGMGGAHRPGEGHSAVDITADRHHDRVNRIRPDDVARTGGIRGLGRHTGQTVEHDGKRIGDQTGATRHKHTSNRVFFPLRHPTSVEDVWTRVQRSGPGLQMVDHVAPRLGHGLDVEFRQAMGPSGDPERSIRAEDLAQGPGQA